MSAFPNCRHELTSWPGASGGPTSCRMKPSASASPSYALHMSSDIEGRLALCRASTRTGIRDRLQDITTAAGTSDSRSTQGVRKQPPLRSYAHDGYLVSYQVDPETRRVVVLDLGPVPALSTAR
jgi:hypothetical protein